MLRAFPLADPPEDGWLVEHGIGEHRAIRFSQGQAVAARLDWPGRLAAGQVEDALLVSRTAGSPRGTLRFASAEEALVDGLPREASEGAVLRAVITRAAMAETGRLKRAQARPSALPPCPAPSLAQALRSGPHAVKVVREFPAGEWQDLFELAWSGETGFAGGALTVTPTPAMTLIDIDGTLPPRALCEAAVPAIARTVGLLDLAGSIGIDFPSLEHKADRQAVDAALARALDGWAHERTAMNGFGFVQLIARLERPSLLHRISADRAGAAARLLLRQGERIAEPGAILLCSHPSVDAAILPNWEAELARRSGRMIVRRTDSSLAIQGGYAQAIAA